MQLRWQSKHCTPAALRYIEDAVRNVESKLQNMTGDAPVCGYAVCLCTASEELHVPTAINDELSQSCVSVAVSPNARVDVFVHLLRCTEEGCCFRGMECAQFEVNGRVITLRKRGNSPLQTYNIAILLRHGAVQGPSE